MKTDYFSPQSSYRRPTEAEAGASDSRAEAGSKEEGEAVGIHQTVTDLLPDSLAAVEDSAGLLAAAVGLVEWMVGRLWVDTVDTRGSMMVVGSTTSATQRDRDTKRTHNFLLLDTGSFRFSILFCQVLSMLFLRR
jgi:hypothetical protein